MRNRPGVRWKGVQARMESLWAPSLRMTCEATMHPGDGIGGSRMLFRIDDDVFWDYPGMFFGDRLNPSPRGTTLQKNYGSWYYPVPVEVIERYINTPVADLFEPIRDDDHDLCDILRAADRRIGFKRLMWWAMFEMPSGSLARKVLASRFNKPF